MKSKIGENQAVTNALNSIPYKNPTYQDIQDGYDVGGGTTTPTQVTISGCKGYYKAIVIEWDCQLNLTNLDHYEIQVSEDNLTWYSLRDDGVDWKGTLGTVTEVPFEFWVHKNIPHTGTDEDPKGRRLYYRVRRKTKDGESSEWSDSASATTLLVQTGDYAVGSIIAPYVKAGSMSARELVFGVNENSVGVDEDCELADLNAELFDLSQPSCVSSKNTPPKAGRQTVYAQPFAVDEMGREYSGFHSPKMIGLSEAIFAERENIVKDPEDLTTSNWINNGSPASTTLSDEYYNHMRFTKIVGGAGAGDGRAQIISLQDGTNSCSILARKKSGNGVIRFGIADATTSTWRGYVDIVISTQTISDSLGIYELEWIDEETVCIRLICSSCVAANVNKIIVQPDRSVSGESAYFTAVQTELEDYPSPYIDRFRWPIGVRSAVSPRYTTVAMPEKFVFKVKIRPWFTYDTSVSHHFFSWYIDVTHRFRIAFNVTNDKIFVAWQDGGTVRYLESQQFDDGSLYDDINSEIILFGAIDLSTQTGNNRFFAIVSGTKQTEDNDWSGVPDTLASSIVDLYMGNENGSLHADFLIEYVKLWTWDGSALGILNDETDIDRVTADLTELFSWAGEDYTKARYKPVSRQGAIGIFKDTENVLKDSEDLNGSSWYAFGAGTSELSDYFIDGMCFSKVTAGGTGNNGRSQDFTAIADNYSVQIRLKRGSQSTTSVQILTSAHTLKLNIQIDWDAKTVSTGDVTFIKDDIAWVRATVLLTAGDHYITCFTYTISASDYFYATAVMIEQSDYPTPYTPTKRVAGQLDYPKELPEKFTIMFTVWPWFLYNTATSHRFFEWYIDATHRFLGYFDPATDKIVILWQDGGTARYLYSQQFDNGASYDDINQYILVCAAIDLAGGQTGSLLRVYADSIGQDADWGGVPDAKSSDFFTMSIGQQGGSIQADSFFSDFMFLPGQLLTTQDMDIHYWKSRPWVSLGEVASFNKQIRIGRDYGALFHNVGIGITDWLNRYIGISNKEGLLAKDAAGQIIHDIPNAPILTDMRFGGHIIWKEAPNFLESIQVSYTDIETDRTVSSSLSNLNIGAYTGGITNSKGALLLVVSERRISSAKALVGTSIFGGPRYSMEYNTTPGTYNFLSYFYDAGQVAGVVQFYSYGSQVLCPVVYSGGTPYITWLTHQTFAGMNSASGSYRTTIYLYLLGLLV